MQGRTIWRLICGLLSGQPSCDHNKSRCCEGQLINDNNWLPIAWSTQVPKPVTIILLMTSSVPLPNVWGYSSGWGCTVSCVRLSIFSTSHYGGKKKHFWSLLACGHWLTNYRILGNYSFSYLDVPCFNSLCRGWPLMRALENQLELIVAYAQYLERG